MKTYFVLAAGSGCYSGYRSFIQADYSCFGVLFIVWLLLVM